MKDIETFGPWEHIHRQDFSPAVQGSVWYPSADATKSTPTILICDQYGSSMDPAWDLLSRQAIQTWDSVIVTEQTAGRGQFRRNWVSPVGNLYASWVWPEFSGSNSANAYQENLLPLVAAYIVARGLELLGIDVQIKWPNDLLYKNRKIGGILIEQRNKKIIVGIGINMASAPSLRTTGPETFMAATCLSKEGFDISPLKVWFHLVESGIHCFEMLIKQIQPSEFIHLLTDRLAWRGKHVHILKNGEGVCSAIIIGIAENGGLLIKKNAKTEVLHSGRILTVE
ncbi:biotin--[acetyl-CoA-carboxylase] ligase [Desulfobacter hydrogenophilus]|uniref:biotin--[biotin carboxyl-carrier protein] ligase n=2 Tax=Desulfobacter hydrogenophilus TaxID=2291 RepID=A0A328FIQ6_9BACT|nr:biotin--[acetyl-CoA-carboxylase] ligase [Desulfobacter hydrogenophilus]QBH15625.1 biotin--[acetyl-CoA-carboxylase] ligase [Desulfobacter hydrogenophilus]RAM02877.1 biotin--[acetyl-CoA-carboxylase] ligase [Desulfobacter hydrogenophilus]